MPYIYVDALEDGQEEAFVYTPEAYDAVVEAREQAIADKSRLEGELVEAKTRFADAFLSSPQARRPPDPEPAEQPKTFSSLFS